MIVPEGFRKVQAPGGRIWILREGLPLPQDSDRWDAWLAGEEGGVLPAEGGRSPVRLVSLPGIGDAVIRRCLHGGLLAGMTRDLFPGLARFLRELEASERLRRRGVATPQVLGLYARRIFPACFRACLVSRLVPSGENLRQWVHRRERDDAERKSVLLRTARAVASLHEAGCIHRDLNLSNLLVSPSGIWILDLDGAAMKERLGIGDRGRNLMRLYRSCGKESGRSDPLTAGERISFLRSYAGRDRALFRDLSSWLGRRRAAGAVRRRLTRKRNLSAPSRSAASRPSRRTPS